MGSSVARNTDIGAHIRNARYAFATLSYAPVLETAAEIIANITETPNITGIRMRSFLFAFGFSFLLAKYPSTKSVSVIL